MIVIVLILVIIFLLHDGTKAVYKNGRKYRVLKNDKPEEALLYLEDLIKELEKFIEYLTINKILSEPKTVLLNKKIKNLVLGERPIHEKEVGYTVNKGKEIRVCLRDEMGNFIEKDTVLFIILHELAHIITYSYGHTDEFWENYNHIEKHAKLYGIVKNLNPVIRCPT